MNKIINKIKEIKLLGYYALNRPDIFVPIMKRKLHIMKWYESPYYDECIKYYLDIPVEGKIVFDVGCDFGTSPMLFYIKKAFGIYGFSLEKPYEKFNIYQYLKDYNVMFQLIPFFKKSMVVLKSDCEGWEWNFTPEFVDSFDDWIIALHLPILNDSLYKYIKENGICVDKRNDNEFEVWRMKKW